MSKINRCIRQKHKKTKDKGEKMGLFSFFKSGDKKKTSDGLVYELLPDGTYAVKGLGKCKDIELVIPETYKGKPVTVIGEKAFCATGERDFYESQRLTSVEIPNSVIVISEGAFGYCKNLKNVVMGESVKKIGKYSFVCCENLTSVNIPNSVTIIDEDAFGKCNKLANVNIPNSVTKIGKLAFWSCESLTSVTIPNSVTTLEEGVFSHCENLVNVVIPNSVTTIGDQAFFACRNLTNLVIPDSVITIGKEAFWWCRSLTNVVIPDSVIKIGEGAFKSWEKLEYVVIGKNVQKIENYAFLVNLDEVKGNWQFLVYYRGTAEDWSKVKHDKSALVYFNKYTNRYDTLYFYSETQPTEKGNYWRYVNGVPTVWESATVN